MGIECEHGQLARSCNICELEALLKSSEEEMLFWRPAHRDADKRATELEAEIEKALKVNNPCGHTGFESTVCEICGYPDPRKMIAALKAEIEMGKKREDATEVLREVRMKKNVWDLLPDEIAILPGLGFFRWNRDIRTRRPGIGKVTVRELVSVSDKTIRQRFIRGIDVEIQEVAK